MMVRHRLPGWARLAIVVTGLLPAVTGYASGAVHQTRRVAMSADGSRSIGGSAGDETTTRGGYAVSLADRRHDVSSAHGGHPVARMATRYVGTPYVWGGASPSGFDCSGFVKYVYAKLGVVLPRTVRDQYAIGTAVSRDRLRAGDIVFFDRLRHNGVYLGDGRLIHASTMDGAVRIAKLNEGWFKKRWVGARRLQPAAALQGDGSATVSGPVERIVRTSGSTQAAGKRYGAGLIASPYPPTAPRTAGS
jgi:cell wall-associated NlpC family hydrolase